MLAKQLSQPISFHPLTSERWSDLEKLFGPRGATGGCWCMFWRLTRSEYEQLKGNGNKALFKNLVDSGEFTGLLAYAGEVPAGWISFGPREGYDALERSRILARVDDEPVWSVVCFFVAKKFRKAGITQKLLEAAREFARQHGARLLEGYPIEPKKDEVPPVFAYTGFANTFREVGFNEVARRSETRPIMRCDLSPNE